MAAASLTVGTVQVTAVGDVTADFPAPLEGAFPEVEAAPAAGRDAADPPAAALDCR